jgi:non-ribosomal peptide synthetase component F
VVLLAEFQALYQGKKLPEIEVQYEHYVEWYNAFLESDLGRDKEKFWLDQFADGQMSAQLKPDFPKKNIKKYTEKADYYEFKDEYRDGLLQFCSNHGVTLNMLMLSIYHILLWKWLRRNDVVTGLSAQGRTIKDVSNMMGMFVNTLAIRNYPSGEKSFMQFLSETKEVLANAYANQEYPFDMLIDKVNPKDKQLINTLFIMQTIDYGEIDLQGIKVRPYNDYIETDGRFELQVNIFNTSGKHLNLCFIYSKELYKEQSIKILLDGYVSILEQALQNPEQLLSEFEISL